jgi:hypothetical protein
MRLLIHDAHFTLDTLDRSDVFMPDAGIITNLVEVPPSHHPQNRLSSTTNNRRTRGGMMAPMSLRARSSTSSSLCTMIDLSTHSVAEAALHD